MSRFAAKSIRYHASDLFSKIDEHNKSRPAYQNFVHEAESKNLAESVMEAQKSALVYVQNLRNGKSATFNSKDNQNERENPHHKHQYVRIASRQRVY